MPPPWERWVRDAWFSSGGFKRDLLPKGWGLGAGGQAGGGRVVPVPSSALALIGTDTGFPVPCPGVGVAGHPCGLQNLYEETESASGS